MRGKEEIVELLMKLIDGTLDTESQSEVLRLIEQKPEIKRLHTLLARLKDASREDRDLKKAASALVERFVRDMKMAKDEREPARGVLSFDSGLLPLPAGVRPATVDSRRLRYIFGERRLEVSIYPASPGTYEVIGQASGFASGDILTADLEGAPGKMHERSNRFQVFHFERVPAGTYTLRVTSPGGSDCLFTIEI